jgi:hypothetical protein
MTDAAEIEHPGPTKPCEQHAWLQQLLGEWTTETSMVMAAGQPPMVSKGSETVVSLGGLWAFSEGTAVMPDGDTMDYKTAIGYDVSFKEYRGCWFASASSHLWQYIGTMSDDRKTLTLDCEGPDMVHDGRTAKYRDVIEIQDEDHRTLTSYCQQPDGSWVQFIKCAYTRIIS